MMMEELIHDSSADDAEARTSLPSLPDVAECIVEAVATRDLYRLRATCDGWRHVASSEGLWSERCRALWVGKEGFHGRTKPLTAWARDGRVRHVRWDMKGHDDDGEGGATHLTELDRDSIEEAFTLGILADSAWSAVRLSWLESCAFSERDALRPGITADELTRLFWITPRGVSASFTCWAGEGGLVRFEYYVTPPGPFKDLRQYIRSWRVHACTGNERQYVTEIDIQMGEPPDDGEPDTRRFVPVYVSRRTDWGWRLFGGGVDLVSLDTSLADKPTSALVAHEASFVGSVIEGQCDSLLDYDTDDDVPLS